MVNGSDNVFGVLPVEVQTAAKSCGTTADQVQGQLQALKSFVQNLEGEWQGIAAQTFQSLMTDYDIYSTMLENALRDIGQGLTGNYVNYTDAENANISSLVSVNGDIPGGNFG
jgi:WXG100 family type VII secretion target